MDTWKHVRKKQKDEGHTLEFFLLIIGIASIHNRKMGFKVTIGFKRLREPT